MAQDRKITKYEVSPIEDESDVLIGLKIQRTERITRESDNGRMLNYGQTVDVGEPLEIPLSKVADLVRELVDWPIYFASGAAERDR
ncbi:hypothetical protein SEA_MICULUCIGAS_78 [Mycobacterium Phage MiculUcigas]|nr:hypothetical protein SEA_MICULUCIGAS_78 [Mycobacterium Phage MiculUcigas]